jgi:hypothetical protein
VVLPRFLSWFLQLSMDFKKSADRLQQLQGHRPCQDWLHSQKLSQTLRIIFSLKASKLRFLIAPGPLLGLRKKTARLKIAALSMIEHLSSLRPHWHRTHRRRLCFLRFSSAGKVILALQSLRQSLHLQIKRLAHKPSTWR